MALKADKFRKQDLVVMFAKKDGSTGRCEPPFQQIRQEEELLSFQCRSRGSNENRARGTKRRNQDAATSE